MWGTVLFAAVKGKIVPVGDSVVEDNGDSLYI